MPVHRFILNGKKVKVDVESDVRLLWVLRDIMGVRGPKYGCGIGACQACTSHLNGQAVNICCIPVGKLKPTDRITTIEGLPKTVGKKKRVDGLHPMQAAWLDIDVAQCGYCQPGQIMAAVAKVNEVRRSEGRKRISDKDIDEIRNICRCGTYPRIRQAIKQGAKGMPSPRKQKKAEKAEAKKQRKPKAVETEPTATPTTAPTAEATAAPTTGPTGVPEVQLPEVQVPGVEVPEIDLGIIQVK